MTAFFVPHVLVAITIAAYVSGRPWAFALPTWVFFSSIVIDQLFAAGDRAVLVPHAGRRFWRAIVYTWVPLHAAALVCGLIAVTQIPEASPLFWTRVAALAVALGMIGGTLGGSLAHELLHAPRTVDRVIGTALMSLLSYGHFSIGHVAGHHRLVGTTADPATARRGESLYAFLLRAFPGCVAIAWRAEVTRLRRKRLRTWSPSNRMLQIAAWQLTLYVAVHSTLGWRGTMLFAMQSVIGASLLEVMNYIMHYGLERRLLPSGRIDAVRPDCSWNTRRLATTYVLCGIGLHSYHHCRPSKPFATLTCPRGAPELPAGLFALFVLAWFPPLWRSVMDPLADFWMREARPPGRTRPGGVSHA